MARPGRTQPKIRLNLDMPAGTKQQLEDLRDMTHADSMSEVIRRALALYDFLWQEKQNGATTIIRAKDGSEQKLPLI